MTEQMLPGGHGESTEPDNRIVVSGGTVSHGREDMEEMLREEVEGHQALRDFVRWLDDGETLEERLQEMAEDFDRHPF